MAYYVYIIESKKDDTWYYGYSLKPERGLKYHNEGKSRYTKSKMPWRLIFIKNFNSKKEALKFERKLKSLRNQTYIKSAYAIDFL